MTSSFERVLAAGLVATLALGLAACGGGGVGGGNDGTVVVRTNLIVTGLVDDGTPTSPLPLANCSLSNLAGGGITSDVADDNGELRFIVPPATRGVTSCAPAGLPNLVMRAFLSTVGEPEGGLLGGQDVLPAYTPVARVLQLELADAPQLDVEARSAELLAALQTDPALGLLGDIATGLFNLLLDNALNLSFAVALFDIYEDGVLDADGYDAIAAEVDALIVAAEAEHGLTVEAAYLQVFPSLDLTLLHHSGAESALRFYAEDQQDFGGVARFVTLMRQLREAVTEGGLLTVSAGDHVSPSKDFSATLNLDLPYLDAVAARAVDYDVFGTGTRDFGHGPGIFSAFVRDVSDGAPFVGTNLAVAQEFQLSAIVRDEQLVPQHVIDVNGRGVGVLTALDEEFRNRTSARSTGVFTPVAEVVQDRIDALGLQGVDIVVLIGQMRDLDEDLALLASLSGVDVMIAAGDDAILANPGDVLIPGDDARVAGVYPLLEPDLDANLVPVVATGGHFGYIGQVRLRFDAAGQFVEVLAGAPVRVAGGAEPDAVAEDATVLADAVVPLQNELDRLAATPTATTNVELDATTASLTTVETNFGNVVADGLLLITQIVGSQFGAPFPEVAVLDAGSLGRDEVIASGTVFNNLDGFEVLDPTQIIGVLRAVTPEELKRLLEHAVAQGGGPEFLQVANLEIVWDPSGTAQELDVDGTVLVEGTRIRSVEFGPVGSTTALVTDGAVVTGAPIVDVATTEYFASGALGHPTSDLDMVNVGETLSTAFNVYLNVYIDGVISQATYPVGGNGRIVQTP